MNLKSTLVVGVGVLAVIGMVSVFSGTDSMYVQREHEEAISQEASKYFSIMRRNVNTGKVETSDYLKAVNETRKMQGKRSTLGLEWESMGPDNIGGRTRAILIDKDNADKLYAGGVTGGLYVSENAGGTWTYLSSGWENINVSTIVQDGDGTIYVGTGNSYDANAPSNFEEFPGGGIWVSTDGGASFSRLTSTIPSAYSPGDEWAYVNRMAVSNNKNSSGNYTIYAGTKRGLKVSTDNGQTWFEPIHIDAGTCNLPDNGSISDVVLTSDDKVFVARNGGMWIATDGTQDCGYTQVATIPPSSSRMSIAICPSDENNVYAMVSHAASRTLDIYKSTDKGVTWALNAPLPPTPGIDSNFDIFGQNPVTYNQAISVHPTDCGKIFVGAVQVYRVAGSWTRVAYEFGGGSGYVHSDKHFFVHDKKNPSIMYLGTDGGIGKSTNASDIVMNFTTNNRGYTTTQYYGIAFSRDGQIMGGTQDNGTHFMDPSNVGTGKDALNVFSGDGFDCEISTIGEIAFATSQGGVVGRLELSGNQVVIFGGGGPFYSVVRLWENTNDLTSQDSLNFKNDTLLVSIGSGNGNTRDFNGTLLTPQINSDLVPGSSVFIDIGGNQTADDSAQPGIIRSDGDSIGFVDYNTGEYQLKWKFAPPQGSVIKVSYFVKYKAGAILFLKSHNQEIPFTYVLPADLNIGDSVLIQDPVQTLLAIAVNGGVALTREALYSPLVIPSYLGITSNIFPELSTPTSLEFSKDGNDLYVGTYAGTVIRLSGINDLYQGDIVADKLTATRIFNTSSPVSGIAIHPTDPGKLLVTVGGYGGANHVYELGNADNATGTGNAMRRIVQGDLPDFPVYDGEYNVNNPKEVLIGTELGVWATDDIDAASVSWSQETGAVGNTPTLDVRQQWLPFNEASNFGTFYIGTYGRGIWKSTNLVGFGDNNFAGTDFEDFKPEMKLYPNPVTSVGTVTFNLPKSGSVEFFIYDLNGRMVKKFQRAYSAGEVRYEFDSRDMKSGTYFITAQVGEAKSSARFVVVK